MTIQITKPEVEALINQRLQNGGFKDAEDVVWQALQSSPPKTATPPGNAASAKDMVELFAPCVVSILILRRTGARTRAGTLSCEGGISPLRAHRRGEVTNPCYGYTFSEHFHLCTFLDKAYQY